MIMNGQLEYLMSSLPYLTFQNTKELRGRVESTLRKYYGEERAAVGLVEILEKEAGKFLPARLQQHFNSIELSTLHLPEFQNHSNQLIATYSKYLFTLKARLKQLRAAGKSDQSGADEELYEPLELKDGTPLEKEIQIMQMQWDKLEELSIGHHFDFESLILYKLKLMILTRWWSFDEKQGFTTFEKVIQEKAYDG